MPSRRVPALVAAAATLVLGTPAASAAQTYGDTIGGYEYYATSTDGKFAGTAAGTLPGDWNADVRHTALCISCTPTATITGGSFSLVAILNDLPTLVTGSFVGGTVQVTNPGPDCTDQTFAVNGGLGSVGPWYSGSGGGTFAATLTHHRYRLFGSCVTYAASIAGTLTLSF
jgi:hypothetical protein